MTDSSRTTDSLGMMFAGKYLLDTTAVVGFQVAALSGTITSGAIRVYGIAK